MFLGSTEKVSGSSGHAGSSGSVMEYRSFVTYHCNLPHWNETIRISNLPSPIPQTGSGSPGDAESNVVGYHLYIAVRHVSASGDSKLHT
jgi:hypothetical protein